MQHLPIILDWPDVKKKLIIDIAKWDEFEEILQFLMKHFLETSPNTHLLSWDLPLTEDTVLDPTQDEGHKIVVDEVRNVLECCLESGPYTITIRDQSEGNRLVAVRLNELEKYSTERSGGNGGGGPPDWLLFSILKEMWQVNLFPLYQTDYVFHMCIVAVSEQYARRGLATKLNEVSVQLAIQSGAGVMKAEAISEYAIRGLAKFGFAPIKTIDYATYQYKGVKPLAGNQELLAEHPVARLMVRRLP